MFPSEHDVEAFRTEFGAESIIHRLAIPRQSFCGTQAAVVMTPASTKDETLARAWELVRAIAHWILARAPELPANERYEVIVGWSQAVRRKQGQIFKWGGELATIRGMADSSDWRQYEQALRHNWGKDVFEKR